MARCPEIGPDPEDQGSGWCARGLDNFSHDRRASPQKPEQQRPLPLLEEQSSGEQSSVDVVGGSGGKQVDLERLASASHWLSPIGSQRNRERGVTVNRGHSKQRAQSRSGNGWGDRWRISRTPVSDLTPSFSPTM